jgi:hypothetical protein
MHPKCCTALIFNEFFAVIFVVQNLPLFPERESDGGELIWLADHHWTRTMSYVNRSEDLFLPFVLI